MEDGIFAIVNEHSNSQIYSAIESALQRPNPPSFDSFQKQINRGQRLNPIRHLNEDIFRSYTASRLEEIFNGGIYYVIKGKVYSLKIFEKDAENFLRTKQAQH